VTDPSKAVFLSYASQDAEAAKRICDTLRAAGIEVWFDQSELRGGDAWDQMIRRQIKACYLFVPVISANTQSREEGYFRREWNLAVARTLDMAEDRAFLLPIVIDGTSDSEARVPEKFREVQWTRLPVGSNTDSFIHQVCRLLSPEATRSSGTSVGSSARASRSLVRWVVGGLLIIATGYILADKFLSSKHAVPVAETPAATPAPFEAVSDKSVAVLPFVDMSEKKDQEYFSDGLAEELIEQIGKTSGLKVIARTSSFSFKGKSDDIPTIASKLKVSNILEGSVRRSGDHLRVSTQLIRADTGQPLWSETFDREFKDVFKIQDEISAAVVSALKLKLRGAQVTAAAHGTTNPEAFSAYLLGRQLYTHAVPASTTAEFRQTIEAYHKAISLDPHYAEAYADLAMSEYHLARVTGDSALEKLAEQTTQKAIDLNPGLAIGYSTRGTIRFRKHYNWVGAEADFKQALALEPTARELHRYGVLLTCLGHTEEAVAILRKAIDQNPLIAKVGGGLAWHS